MLVSNFTLRPIYLQREELLVLIGEEAGWPAEPVWMW
jgi:hypothetical protein